MRKLAAFAASFSAAVFAWAYGALPLLALLAVPALRRREDRRLRCALVCAGAGFVQTGSLFSTPLYVGLALLGLSLAGALLSKSSARSWRERGERVLGRYGVHTPQELEALLQQALS